MTKYVMWTVVGGGLLSVLVFGPRAAWNHAAASRQAAQEAIERNMPDAELLARLRILVQRLTQSGDKYRAELGIVQRKHDQLAEEKAKVERQLQQEREILEKAQSLLASGNAEVKVGDRAYSIDQVQLDCKQRLEHCQQLDADIAVKAKALDTLSGTIARGRTQLSELESLRRSKLTEIDSLEARLQSAGMLAQVNVWTDRLERAPEGLGQEFASAVDELQRRVLTLESEADRSSEQLAGPALIDWSESRESAADLAGEISRYLGHGNRPANGAASQTETAAR